MKKDCQWAFLKNYLLFGSVLLLVIIMFIPYSYGEEKDVKYGLSVFGGTGDAIHSKPNMSTYGFFPRVGLALHKKWDLEFEGNFSHWNISHEKNLDFLGANVNFLFKPFQWTWGSLFLLAGGGLGYDNAGNRVSEIGDSHFGGILQTGAGIYYNLGKGWAVRGEYRFYHISEPFRRDEGLNTHIFLLGFSF